MTKRYGQISDATLEKMRTLGVHIINIPNQIDFDDIDDIDDITLFAHLSPFMIGLAEALGTPPPSHKDIKDLLEKTRQLAKLQAAKEK